VCGEGGAQLQWGGGPVSDAGARGYGSSAARQKGIVLLFVVCVGSGGPFGNCLKNFRFF